MNGISEGVLRQVAAGRGVLEVREHFFLHGNVLHSAFAVKGPKAIEAWNGV